MTRGEGRGGLRLVPPSSAFEHRVSVYKTYLRKQGQLQVLVRASELEAGEDATHYKWYASCSGCDWRACSWSWWRKHEVVASGMNPYEYLREQGVDPTDPAQIDAYCRGGALLMAFDHVKLLAEPFEWIRAL